MATVALGHSYVPVADEKPLAVAASTLVPTPTPTPAAPDKRSVRTHADEAADYQAMTQNVASRAFEDWPNEAGFDGLVEERGPIAVPVVGTIPGWAAGNLYRTGPGQCKVENTPKGTHYISHWFDGLAHSHRFEIVAGEGGDADDSGTGTRVFYSSRRQSEAVAALLRREGGKQLFSFGQRSDPCVGLLGKFMTTFRTATAPRKGPVFAEEENVSVVVLPDMPPMATDGETATTTTVPLPEAGHRRLPANVWITTDAHVMRKVDPATLEPLGMALQDSLHPALRGPMSAAHAQRDPATGDVYNFNLEVDRVATYRVFRVGRTTGRAEILATIQCGSSNAMARPAYIHSFFLTAHYVVLCIPSCTHVAHYGLKMLWTHNVVDGLEPARADRMTRWIVVDRRPGRTGVVAELDSEPGFFFHSVNAYEEAEAEANGIVNVSIVCDRMDYPNFDIVRALYYDVLLNREGAATAFYSDPKRVAGVTPSLSRFRLRLPLPGVRGDVGKGGAKTGGECVYKSAATDLRAERLWSIPGPHAGELPTINPALAMRPHRYVYSVSSHGLSTLADALCKTDTETRAALHWRAPHGHTPGEAIFVPRPGSGARAEDDGVLLTVVLDGTTGTSYLLCLDARTMEALGRAEVGVAIGFGFHGAFVDGK